jgi:hypothetical protein
MMMMMMMDHARPCFAPVPHACSDLNVLKVQTLVLAALGSVLAFVWLVPRSALPLAACNSPVCFYSVLVAWYSVGRASAARDSRLLAVQQGASAG